jgi:hypothetical protein
MRPEMAAFVKEHFIDLAYLRKQAGEDVEPGEQRGYSYGIARILCWYLSLSESDRKRIQTEGEELRLIYERLPGPPRKKAILPFERLEESVLCPESGKKSRGDKGPRTP